MSSLKSQSILSFNSFSGLPASRHYHSVLNQQNIASKFQHCYFMAPFSEQWFEARSHSSKVIPPESLSAFSWNMISGTSSVPCWFSMVTASVYKCICIYMYSTCTHIHHAGVYAVLSRFCGCISGSLKLFVKISMVYMRFSQPRYYIHWTASSFV